MLSKSARAIQDHLTSLGVEAQVIELASTTRTAEEAAKAIGCTVPEITKSLIFRTKHSKEAILVLASGKNRVNEKVISMECGEEIERADPDFVREKTGFAIGGVPPIGMRHEMRTFIDKDLLQHVKLWAAAGTPNAVFCFDSSILEKMTQGKVISINK